METIVMISPNRPHEKTDLAGPVLSLPIRFEKLCFDQLKQQ